MWKGSISFALISIPVKLYPATHRKDISFKLLHKTDATPVQYKKHCPVDDEDLSWEDIVRGYQYQRKKFVVITDEELEKIPEQASKTIGIEEFIDVGGVEPVYFDKSYFLEPAPGGERPYVLLREAMRRTGKAALARFTLKEKQHMSVIRLYGDALLLNTLLYHDEIANPVELAIPSALKLNETELSLAQELINRFSGRFEAEKYRDTYRESLMQLINAKIEGKEIRMPPPPEGAKVLSLMDALRKSLEKKAGRAAAAPPGPPAAHKEKKPERKRKARAAAH